MRKDILKKQNGITLIVLMITIVVLLILASVTIRNIDTGTDIRNYNYMCADIELLKSKIINYYNEKAQIPNNKKAQLPIIGTAFNAKTKLEGQASSRDNDNYYQIDITKLYNITLNYGGGTLENEDIYIINEQSFEIYYLKGAKYENTTYHTKKQ